MTRLLAFSGLAAFGLLRWGAMLAPRQTGRAWAGLGLALLVALAGLGARRLRPRGGSLALGTLALLAAVPGALLVAGIPGRLLHPRHWDELAAGLGRGFSAMPDMLLPFLGPGSSWPARTIITGGATLAVLAAWLVFRPGRDPDAPPWAGAVALGVLAGVPAVVLRGDGAVGRGVVLLLGLIALLAGGSRRAGRPDARFAPGLVLLAVAVAVALFPALDAANPWLAYEAAARSLARAPERFSFSQTYGPIDWPRSGRELFRVRADRTGYWKAADLETFDGRRWLIRSEEETSDANRDVGAAAIAHPEWRRQVDVTVRGLADPDVVAPGEVLSVSGHLGDVQPAGTPGRLRWQATPRDGDTYGTVSYDPRPSPAELEQAGTDYPDYLQALVTIDLGRVRGFTQSGPIEYFAGMWGSGSGPAAAGPIGAATAGQVMGASNYAGVARLAAQLKAGAATPYDYARRIERHLSRGFAYTETPRSARVPLADFLLATHRGYCQQFSGAMALLLRLGGVPARVAAGFAPGHRDAKTGEWIVSDREAHSWVEAWFPGIGWVTFDPTPAASPARGQSTVNHSPLARLVGGGNGRLEKHVSNGRRAAAAKQTKRAAAKHADSGAVPWVPILLLLAALGTGGGLLLRRRALLAEPGPERAVAELERALRRSGRPTGAGMTLRQIEARLVGSADAAAYVRALRFLRYGAGARGPTSAQRRGLRRELARGLGPLGVLRAWWALPPRP